ncbi:copper transporter [Sphaerisporangium aureirubrum]|uniref:Copper transporter n=1 Tax=Sphaerisporangium aureirubrum TaxID=1544736 RepID=A0ABW1NJT2_9ACTN
MIDFRYHLVSIVAIFLALALGIVLGSTVLYAPLVRFTEDTAARLRARNYQLQAEKALALTRGGASDAFVAERLPRLVEGSLAGESVVLVEAPGADARQGESLLEAVTAAGATLSGRVALTDRYLAADQATALDQLATTVKPLALTFPVDSSPYQKAAAVLASALVTTDKTVAGKENPVSAGVLDSFETGGLVTLDGEPAKPATLAIVVAPATPPEGKDAGTQTGALVSLASGLDAAAEGSVVAGVVPTSTAAGLIAAVRSSGEASAAVSTVDNIDMAFGRVVVVYALREQVAGEAGQYGLGSDATATEPEPLPAATPSPTPDGGTGG